MNLREGPLTCCSACWTSYTWTDFRALPLHYQTEHDRGELATQPERRTCAACGLCVSQDTTGMTGSTLFVDASGAPVLGRMSPTATERNGVAVRVLLAVALVLWSVLVAYLVWRWRA